MENQNKGIDKSLIIPVSAFGNNCGLNCLVHVICNPAHIEQYFGPEAFGLGMTTGEDILHKYNDMNPENPLYHGVELMQLLQENPNPYFRERLLGPILRQLAIERIEATMNTEKGLAKFYDWIAGPGYEGTGAAVAPADLSALKANPSEMFQYNPLRWFAGSMGIRAIIHSQWEGMEHNLQDEAVGVERALNALVPNPIAEIAIVHEGSANHWEFLGNTEEEVIAHKEKIMIAIQEINAEIFQKFLSRSIEEVRTARLILEERTSFLSLRRGAFLSAFDHQSVARSLDAFRRVETEKQALELETDQKEPDSPNSSVDDILDRIYGDRSPIRKPKLTRSSS